MSRQVPRILRLSPEHAAADGTRFALLHVVAGEGHHLGWFELSDDEWRVGLTAAVVVAEAGVPAHEVRDETEELLERLREADEVGDTEVPEPVGPLADPGRYSEDRRRAIGRLADELAELEEP